MGFKNLITRGVISLKKKVMWFVDSVILFFTDLIEAILTFFSSIFIVDKPTDQMTSDDYNRLKPGGSNFTLWGQKKSYDHSKRVYGMGCGNTYSRSVGG